MELFCHFKNTIFFYYGKLLIIVKEKKKLPEKLSLYRKLPITL